MELFGHALDFVVIILLFSVIIFAIRLNHHINVLQKSKAELSGLLDRFVESTNYAHKSLDRVRRETGESGQNISHLMRDVENMKNTLSGLISRAELAAHTLERSTNKSVSVLSTRNAGKRPMRKEQANIAASSQMGKAASAGAFSGAMASPLQQSRRRLLSEGDDGKSSNHNNGKTSLFNELNQIN